MDRTCRKCGYVGPVESFPSAGILKGVQYYRHQCNSCYVSMKRDRKHRIRDQICEYKKTLSCSRCGFDDWRAIQFHHHSDDKEYNVSDMVRLGYPFDRIEKEIGKCTPLCANCHSIEHHEERYGV